MDDQDVCNLKFTYTDHSIDVRFVVPSEIGLNLICQKICGLSGVSGNVRAQPKDPTGYNWSEGMLNFRSFAFHLFLSSCPIEIGNTEAENRAVFNEDGKTNTFYMRLSDFSKNGNPVSHPLELIR